MIWLIGNKGMLGTELSLLFDKSGIAFIGTDREVDICDPGALLNFASARPVDWIINCAAYTAVDKAEDDEIQCRLLNTQGAANIAAAARAAKARLIHISTDYVFDGNGNRPYSEEDITNPVGVYGFTKRDGENIVLSNNPSSYIIRTAWLYGRYGNNFVNTMLRLMEEKDSVSVVNDQRGNPTWAFDLSEAIVSLIQRVESGKKIPYGIYHFANEGTCTWFEFAEAIYEEGTTQGILSKPCEIKPCTSAEYPAKVKRPAYSALDKSKIKRELGIEIPGWEGSLKKYLKAAASERKDTKLNQISKIAFLKPVLEKLFRLLTRRHKIYMIILIVMSVGFSLIETLGVSVIMPFISLAADPDLLASGWYKKAFDFFRAASAESFIIGLGIGIICFYIFRGVYSFFLTYSMNRFSCGMFKHFSKRVFKTVLSVPYKLYAVKNSAELMRTISSETGDVGRITLNILQFCTEVFTILMVYAVIVLLNWKMTLVISAVLLLIVSLLLVILTRENKIQGAKRLVSGRKMNRVLKEAMGNFKYVKLKGNEENILSDYDSTVEMYTRSEVVNNVLGIIPKSILESLGFSFLVAVVVFILWRYHDASRVIPVISMYALALYRILPSIHRMLQNVNNIVYSEKTLDGVYESLRQPVEDEGATPLEFDHSIRLEGIHFKYITGSEVITDVSLEIKKGEKIAITGESGGGKSTLVDIIIGIHKPLSGKVYIDDTVITDDNIRAWRKKIGYIPQSIYLFDGTVSENVSFGSIPDNEKIKKALQMANIWDFLSTKEGINTLVGEGGIQLSGGQQQRIGIARALYDDPDVLVLDEATSALDTDTEQKIMDEIYNVSVNKTLIVIAHRLSTVERCDRRIRIDNGKIIS